ncbi:acyltransferase family protein [Nostocoides sp. F2B08]|uniref:acyltransferase family protein n=1 Tax=Nostocoides sp. F2B08 TaxID=2653936 RepID=UPI001263E5BF|nr:acyltransferase [Tetrasphaera sp. F2B08]KAB7745166.1 acyltransferase family protein [Tetrasphaera sp. F2B08]
MDPTSVRALSEATPETRNRVVDALRALAITVVVVGHWLVAAVVVRDGELVPSAVLDIASWSHPLTWVFQVMPVFFFVGGYANALSWRAARRDGRSYADWVRARLVRLGLPVVPLLVTWLVLASTAYSLGVSGSTLRLASQVALVPTWFLAAYVLVVAVAPATLVLWERWRWWSILAGLAMSLAVDAVSIGTGEELVGFANYLLAWATVHQLGYAWVDGALGSRLRRLALAGVGLVGLLLAVGPGPYPISMIGVTGAELNNSYPTRVTMVFLGLLQGGVILLAERPLAERLRRPRLWTATVAVNARIMTLYLWHLTAMVLVIGLAMLAGGAGLGWEPLSAGWWATRPLWIGTLALVVVLAVALFGRFENPRRDTRPAPPLWVAVLAVVLTCGGLAVMAKFGIVDNGGVTWVWPLLPIAAQVLLRVVPRHAATLTHS